MWQRCYYTNPLIFAYENMKMTQWLSFYIADNFVVIVSWLFSTSTNILVITTQQNQNFSEFCVVYVTIGLYVLKDKTTEEISNGFIRATDFCCSCVYLCPSPSSPLLDGVKTWCWQSLCWFKGLISWLFVWLTCLIRSLIQSLLPKLNSTQYFL